MNVDVRSSQYELCAAVTDEIERRLRDCTIKIPDWVTLLTGLMSELSLPPPAFETVTSQGDTSVSLSISHPNTPSSFVSSSYPTGPRTPEFVVAGRREVSRKAFFALSGADPNSVSISDDRKTAP